MRNFKELQTRAAALGLTLHQRNGRKRGAGYAVFWTAGGENHHALLKADATREQIAAFIERVGGKLEKVI